MTITVGSSTPTGIYPITVTGNGGGIQQNTTVTLTVVAASPDFSITATPASQSVSRGSAVNYTATATALNGFAGTVNLSMTGCPRRSTCAFSPTSLTLPPSPANSTLRVSTNRRTPTGTYTLTITGTSGSLKHSTTVSLTVH